MWVAISNGTEVFGPFETEQEAYQYAKDVEGAIDGDPDLGFNPDGSVIRFPYDAMEDFDDLLDCGWVITAMDKPDPDDFADRGVDWEARSVYQAGQDAMQRKAAEYAWEDRTESSNR